MDCESLSGAHRHRARRPEPMAGGGLILVLGLVAAGCAGPRPSQRMPGTEPVEIGTEIQLVVDDFALERRTAVRRELQPLTKHPANPILRPERPWEGDSTLPGTVLYDAAERRYTMWYRCAEYRGKPVAAAMRPALAVSEDGVSWRRPDLELVEFGGSKRNNLLDAEPWVHSVVDDAHERDPSRRFKSLGYGRTEPAGPVGICLSASPDGLRWRALTPAPLLADLGGSGTYRAIGDVHTLFGWDDRLGRYLAVMVASADFGSIGRSATVDLGRWPIPTPVLLPDDEDPPGTQFAGMSVFGDRGAYFGLLWVHHADSLMIDVQLAFSRDTVAWSRVGGRRPILTYGLPDSFDSHCLYALRPLVAGDEIRVYYGAEDEARPLERRDLRLRTHATPAPVPEQSWLRRRRGYGALATCRRDGFVALVADAAPAEIVTRPFTCRGDRLVLNADASKGEIRVELTDPSGAPLAGFEAGAADALERDGVRQVISWRGRSDLGPLAGKVVRVRMLLNNAKLFSFGLEKP